MAQQQLEKPAKIDWPTARKVFWNAKALPVKERMRIFKRGKSDARTGKLHIDEQGNLSSAYCTELAYEANRRIIEEWGLCNDHAFSQKAFIDQSLHLLQSLRDEQTKIIAERERDLALLRRANEARDEGASAHMVEKRRVRRERALNDRYDVKEAEVRNAITKAELDVIPVIEDYRNAENVASAHESAIRQEYISRLALYAYGASEYFQLSEDVINEAALTNEPRRRHAELFASYDFGAVDVGSGNAVDNAREAGNDEIDGDAASGGMA